MKKAFALDDVYSSLKTSEGQKKKYKIAKVRDKATRNLTLIKQKDKNLEVLMNEGKIKERL